MGFELPEALAGSDNEVELNEKGARKVVRLIAGTTIGAGIIAAGVFLYKRGASVIGANTNPTEGLY